MKTRPDRKHKIVLHLCLYAWRVGSAMAGTMMSSVGCVLNHVTDQDEAQQLQWNITQVRKQHYYQLI